MHKILAVGVGPGQPPPLLSNVIQRGELGKLRGIIQGMGQGMQALGHSPGASFDLDYAEAEPHLLPGLLRTALKDSKPDVIFTFARAAPLARRGSAHRKPRVRRGDRAGPGAGRPAPDIGRPSGQAPLGAPARPQPPHPAPPLPRAALGMEVAIEIG